MVAEEVDVRCVFLQVDHDGPDVADAFHVLPLVDGKRFLKIRNASVRGAIEHPPDATAVVARIWLELHRDGQLVACDLVVDGPGLKHRADARKKVLEQEGSFVCFVRFWILVRLATVSACRSHCPVTCRAANSTAFIGLPETTSETSRIPPLTTLPQAKPSASTSLIMK